MTIERPTETGCAFGHACALEQPLERIRNFIAAIARLAPTIGDEQAAGIIQTLTLEIAMCLEELDDIHGFIFSVSIIPIGKSLSARAGRKTKQWRS